MKGGFFNILLLSKIFVKTNDAQAVLKFHFPCCDCPVAGLPPSFSKFFTCKGFDAQVFMKFPFFFSYLFHLLETNKAAIAYKRGTTH
jgi:hypothetical protein